MVFPLMSSACLLSVKNFSQRISLIREMRIYKKKKKENHQSRPNNNDVVIRHSQGCYVPFQEL